MAMKTKIAAGILTWDSEERRSNRYGAIHLCAEAHDGPSHGTAPLFYNIEMLRTWANHRVKLSAKIIETRTSGHVGDHALGIFPSTPNIGDKIVLGVGLLDMVMGFDGNPDIILKPNDGRETFWIDPRILYRLHDQTVDIYVENTSEDYSPAPEFAVDNEPCAYDNGEGSFQTKNVKAGESVKILPHVERVGDGMFIMTLTPGKGKRLEVRRS